MDFFWHFLGETPFFEHKSPTGFFGPGIVDLPPIQPFHTFPSLFPWDRCPHLGFFGFDIVWHLHLLTKVVPACGFLPEFETLGCCEMDLQKKSLEKSVWSSKLQVLLWIFLHSNFSYATWKPKAKMSSVLMRRPSPHKRGKKTPVPHTGPPQYDATEGCPWFWWRFDTPSYPRWLACNQSPSNSSTSADGPWTIYPLHSLRNPPPKVCLDSLCLKIKT